MTGTYSNSNLERKAPQYAYALAILSGGIAYIVPQLGVPIASWLSYALLAALFGSIWPYKAWQWGGWLCLPFVLLILMDMLITWSIGGLLSSGTIFAKVLLFASLGAYVGSIFSVRKIANRFARRQLTSKQMDRKRLRSNGNGAQNNLVLKELTTPLASAETIFSSHSSNVPVQALEPVAHLHGLNAALINAAQEGDLNKIKLLIADGADVNAESRDQWMPVMIAAVGCNVEMVKTLFGQRATPNASDGQGWTALMIATIEGHVEVVRALLEHGAQTNIRNNEGWTALRFAVSMDETEILHLLLNAGADANIADHAGKTALIQAASENIEESLKALLGAGADPHIKDHNEQTALMIAQKQGHLKIIQLLIEAEAKASTEKTNQGREIQIRSPR
jgi:ankyrin repeat protein